MKGLGLHSKKFNDLVRNMNQSHSKNLVLTAEQANNLNSEIFALLARIVELEDQLTKQVDEPVTIVMRGGSF